MTTKPEGDISITLYHQMNWSMHGRSDIHVQLSLQNALLIGIPVHVSTIMLHSMIFWLHINHTLQHP